MAKGRILKALKKAADIIVTQKVPLRTVQKMKLSRATLLTAASRAGRGSKGRKVLLKQASKTKTGEFR